MRKLLTISLIAGILPLQASFAGVDPSDFNDQTVAPSELTGVQGEPLQRQQTPLIVRTHNTGDQAKQNARQLVNEVLGKDMSSSSSSSSVSFNATPDANQKIQFDTRRYKGMFSCDGECPYDPDTIRNTVVRVEALEGVPLIDIVRSVMPQNWSVVADNISPKKLIDKYAFVTTDTREKTLNEIMLASDLSFEYIYDNFDQNGQHAPIMIIHSGDIE